MRANYFPLPGVRFRVSLVFTNWKGFFFYLFIFLGFALNKTNPALCLVAPPFFLFFSFLLLFVVRPSSLAVSRKQLHVSKTK